MDRDELVRMLSGDVEDIPLLPCRTFSDLFPVFFRRTLSDSIVDSDFPDLKYQLSGYNHFKIIKEGHKKLVARLLKAYPDKNKSDIKKIVTAALLVSKYFAKFPRFGDLETLYRSQAVDDTTLIAFLENFRKDSGIFGMYFLKASQVVMQSQIIDIPALDGDIKRYLMDRLNLPDDNKTIYRELMRLKRRTGHTGKALYAGLRTLANGDA